MSGSPPATTEGAAARLAAEHASVRHDDFSFSERTRVPPDPAAARLKW
jgi:hypothetical protein